MVTHNPQNYLRIQGFFQAPDESHELSVSGNYYIVILSC